MVSWEETPPEEAEEPIRKEIMERRGRSMKEEYTNLWEKGVYACPLCGARLFDSGAKFKSGTKWPSFRKPIEGAIKEKQDFSYGMIRSEIVCAKCGLHLGHAFDDGRECGDSHPEGGRRYCVLSSALDFKK
ncbi:Peptide methionine sulfoxide reductase MsrB [uncultured archaeon]|nr:Peptide methionine sulfoxide reductase MsrB [uncultured archaeon]